MMKMSKDFDDTNRGAIWPNDRMREGKQDPQFTGSLNVDGVEYWVSAWKRKADAKPGSPSLSLSINRKDANKAPRPEPAPAPEDEFDDDIPF
jgi:hypothetical protein